tara:strand:- start:372 stop:557 length:186 start_codon:yes stop_codon:yes gene_type:complete
MESVKNDLKQLAIKCVNDGYGTAEDAKRYLEEEVPEFKNDEIFQELFPILFNIVICESKIS